MRKDKTRVRQPRRGALPHASTAPEGKQVCDAYGIRVPGEGVAKSAGDAIKLLRAWAPVVMRSSPRHPA